MCEFATLYKNNLKVHENRHRQQQQRHRQQRSAAESRSSQTGQPLMATAPALSRPPAIARSVDSQQHAQHAQHAQLTQLTQLRQAAEAQMQIDVNAPDAVGAMETVSLAPLASPPICSIPHHMSFPEFLSLDHSQLTDFVPAEPAEAAQFMNINNINTATSQSSQHEFPFEIGSSLFPDLSSLDPPL